MNTRLIARNIIRCGSFVLIFGALICGSIFAQEKEKVAKEEAQAPKTSLKHLPRYSEPTEERSVSMPVDTFFYMYGRSVSPLRFAIFKWTREYGRVFCLVDKSKKEKIHETFILGEDDYSKAATVVAGGSEQYQKGDGRIGGILRVLVDAKTAADIDFYTGKILIDVEKDTPVKKDNYRSMFYPDLNSFEIIDNSDYARSGWLAHIIDEATGREIIRNVPERDLSTKVAAVTPNGKGDAKGALEDKSYALGRAQKAYESGIKRKDRAAQINNPGKKISQLNRAMADFLEAYLLVMAAINDDPYPGRYAEANAMLQKLDIEFEIKKKAPIAVPENKDK